MPTETEEIANSTDSAISDSNSTAMASVHSELSLLHSSFSSADRHVIPPNSNVMKRQSRLFEHGFNSPTSRAAIRIHRDTKRSEGNIIGKRSSFHLAD